jgi:FG-GAP-like repeat/RTX calcium-binding nonapeptide repeat (4 copies)/FG-GAP repeat
MPSVDFLSSFTFDATTTSNSTNFLRVFSQASKPYSVLTNNSQQWVVQLDFGFGGISYILFQAATTFVPGPTSLKSPPAGRVGAVAVYNSSQNLVGLFDGLGELNLSVDQLISNPLLLVSGSDSFFGSAGVDNFFGGAGNDTFFGREGNDILKGGTGEDVALYSGIRATYTATTSGNTRTVTGIGVSASEGTDTLTDIEALGFLDDVNRVAWGDLVGTSGTDLLWSRSGSATLEVSSLGPGIAAKPEAIAVLLPSGARIQGMGDLTSDGIAEAFIRNASDGTFRAITLYGAGGVLTNILSNPTYDWAVQGVFDINGDGRSDVIWRNADGSVAVWLMNANGSMATSVNFGVVPNSYQIAGFGDFNDDGTADFLWRSASGEAVAWLTSPGGGYTARIFGGAGQQWQILGVNDLNGDGRSDIIWQNASGATFAWLVDPVAYTAVSLGVVPHTSQLLYAADANGDNIADLLWRNTDSTVSVWKMVGGASVGTSVLSTTQGLAYNPAAPKVNRFFDFGPERWFDFSYGGLTAARQVMGSFDAGGSADVAWRNADGQVAIWGLGASGINFAGVSGGVGLNWQIASSAGDFDGNGQADLLWRNGDGQVGFWFMNGASVSSYALNSAVPHSYQIIGTADTDGDGKSDILWRDQAGGLILWKMNGSTWLGANAITLATSTQPEFAYNLGTRVDAFADVNGDGRADIVWRGSDGSLNVWFLNGSNVTSSAGFGQVGQEWQIQAVGDLNADGRADLIWRRDDGLVAVWLMNGGSVLSTSVVTGAGQDWRIIGAGDVNGDGKADIVWRNVESGTVLAWQMNGSSLTGTIGVGAAGAEWQTATQGRLFAT